MAKTAFSAGNQAQGTKGTKVTAAFLNALQTHRHDGLDNDGSCPLDYAAAGGTANAITVALTPAITAHVIGLPIWFKASAANTGVATIAINGLAAVAIRKNATAALVAGDIAAGQIVQMVYDGTYYQLINNGQTVDLSQFSYSHGTTGYQILPNGLIMQWGRSSTPISPGAQLNITFPLTFPTEVYFADVCPVSGSPDNGILQIQAVATTTSNLQIINKDGDSSVTQIRWFAVGK